MGKAIGVIKESFANEKRVALVPDVAGRLIKLGFEIFLEKGAGLGAYTPDVDYEKVGVKIKNSSKEVLTNSDILLTVQPPSQEAISQCKEGSILIGFLAPHLSSERVSLLQNKKITAFALEILPRVTRAQAIDALSSQATVVGYKAALMGANLSGGFFPMLTTAAGTIRPAKVLIIGAGVAGLQAIATCRRLGAIVEAYDVRPAAKEEVQSLGARFVELQVDASAAGGYARELTEEEKTKQQELLSKHVEKADVVITTAQIPGRKVPRLVTEAMIAKMKSGSVIVDLAADSGGNSAYSKPNEVVEQNGVKIYGPVNVPSLLPVHASEMYAKNLYNFLTLLTQDGKSETIDWNDEVIAGTCLTHQGNIKHEATKNRMGGGQ